MEELTPDRARDLACSTVLIAGRRVEVLNGQERGRGICILPGQRFGRHAPGSERQRALEIVLQRRMFTKNVFEELKALGHRNVIVEICICELDNIAGFEI